MYRNVRVGIFYKSLQDDFTGKLTFDHTYMTLDINIELSSCSGMEGFTSGYYDSWK